MAEHRDFAADYVGYDPYSKRTAETKIGQQGIRFTLPRRKRTKKYTIVYDIPWSEVISWDCSEVVICKEDNSWPLDEELPSDFKPIGNAAILFIFQKLKENKYFQIWSYFPQDDADRVRELVREHIGRDMVKGLAHHGTSAIVKYIVDHCDVLDSYQAHWYDWIHRGPSTKPREKKWREKGPVYIFCKEGMAINHYGSGVQLEQMSLFWPWRLIENIFIDDYEILYQWYEDAYTFRQQVWDDDERKRVLEMAKKALEFYRSSNDVPELMTIRPWSFPSRFYRSWDKLEPFVCKASRNGFPPIFDFEDEED